MKKVMFLLATLLIGGLMLTGCKKNPEPTPDPDPTPTTIEVAYAVTNTSSSGTLPACFRLNVTYLDANGQEVTENGVTLPWKKVVSVTSPFHAKMVGELVYNEEELPETVVYGKRYAIVPNTDEIIPLQYSGNFNTASKETFLNVMAQHPDRLQFTAEQDF